MHRNFDLSERLILFATRIITLAESLPGTLAGRYLAGQVTRSGVAPALVYGEALSAESRNDFIHKMKIALKELRETRQILKIIESKQMAGGPDMSWAMDESNQLISIFVTSVQTAAKNVVR
jgi:four helix bundle protein